MFWGVFACIYGGRLMTVHTMSVCLGQGDARREYWILWLELQMVAGT